MSKKPEERIEFLRHAGWVSRMHGRKTIGEYSSNDHVCNMTNMYLVLCPEPTIRMIKILQWHDTGELGAGDTPHYAKPLFGLRDALHKVEELVRNNFDVNMDPLSQEEAMWLMGLDLLEFYLFAQDQAYMGNNFIAQDLNRTEAALMKMCSGKMLPLPVHRYFEYLMHTGRPDITSEELLFQGESDA
jgi:hypothetical protein